MTTLPLTPSAIQSRLRGQGLSHRLAILLILMFATPLLLLFLGSGDPTDMMELFNLVPVREAYRDGHWLMPTLNGSPRFEKPPIAVWLPAGLATLLHNDSLWVLRLPSLVLSLLTCIATYGIGSRMFGHPSEHPIYRRVFALLAALFLPVMILFNRQARLASYDIFAAAFVTFAVYFVLSLIDDSRRAEEQSRPLSRKRWIFWTVLAGLSLGLALLSKGPAPPATVFVPLLLWIAVFHRRKSILLAIPAILLIALATALPWVIAIAMYYPDAWHTWQYEAVKLSTGRKGVGGEVDTALRDPWYYYLTTFLWATPLTPTLVAGLTFPFMPTKSTPQPSEEEHQGRWLCWLVLIGGLALLTFASEKKARYTVQLYPFIALLCASVWQEFHRLNRARKMEAGEAAIFWAQALFFIVPGILGIGAGTWVMITGTFSPLPALAEAVEGITPPLAIFLSAILIALGLYALRRAFRRDALGTAATVVVASWFLLVLIQTGYRSLSATRTNPVRAPVESAIAIAGNEPIYTFKAERPWLHTLFFANRHLMQLDEANVIELATTYRDHPVYLMLITGNFDGSKAIDTPVPGMQEKLSRIERETNRRFQEVSRWLDDKRTTVLLKLAP